MGISKFLKIRPSVLYRWIRIYRSFEYAVLLACVLVFLPLGIAGTVKISHMVIDNRAMAATRAMVPEHSVLDVMSESERAHYARTLGDMMVEDPESLHQLIGNDFLVVFDRPDLHREEGNVAIWQYRAASCVLDVYFKREEGQAGPVIHYEVRHRKMAAFGIEGQHEENVDAAICLKTIYEMKVI